MTKQQFLSELQTKLSGLPRQDIEERLSFYSEMIDDRIEEGIPEEEAVSEIGGTDEIVSQILADYPLSKIVKEKVKPKRSLRVWEIVLLVLGSPIWLSLLIAAFAVALSVYIVIWSVVFSLWAIEYSLLLLSLYGMVTAAIFSFQGNPPTGMTALGLGIFGIGCTIFMFFGCKAVTKGTLVLTKKMFLGMKTMLIRKERSK